MTFDEQNPYLRTAREMKSAGQDNESILQALRGMDAPIMECIKVMMKLEEMSLTHAKFLVHHSAAWADLKEMHEDIHDQLLT